MPFSGIEPLTGRNVTVRLADTLAIEIADRDGQALFASSSTAVPGITFADRRTVPLHSAARIGCQPYDENGFAGHRLALAGFADSDAEFDLVVAIDPTDTLLVAVEQTGGADVRQTDHLYRFEKPVGDGGCMILPHGSGYLIDANCPDALPGTVTNHPNGIGSRWSLPFFGLIRDAMSLCIVVEDWWDCAVAAVHEPGAVSALDITWMPSLGKLAYRRQMKIHCATGMDHTAMAKLYREQYARPQGLVRTLAEKAAVTPVIEAYIKRILVRWPAWNPQLRDKVLEDLKRFREMGFEVTLFFPKWPSLGYSEEHSTANTADAGWMAWIHPNPVPGGWPELKRFFDEVHELGILNQAFMNPNIHVQGGPGFDEDRLMHNEEGELSYDFLCSHDEVERITAAIRHAQAHGLTFDTLYFDAYSAHSGVQEDFSPAHPLTRRQNYAAQLQVMANTRALGTMPGGELCRFWCIGQCDYFFYSDWSADRLTNVPSQESTDCVGDPVPLFQLVFHDCCFAGFSGGGHEAYVTGVDWWHDRTPRLYELLSCSAPCYNWLPQNTVPVPDWDSDLAQAKFAWLHRRSAFFQAIAMSEMTSHEFLSEDRKLQRTVFANGVTAEFDMANNLCRIQGVDGFSGDWEAPCDYLGAYRAPIGSDLES